MEKELSHAFEDMKIIRESFDQLLIDISNAFTGKAISFEEFFDKSIPDGNLVDTATQIVLLLNEFQRQDQQNQIEFKEFKKDIKKISEVSST
jgi:hypothetical protein